MKFKRGDQVKIIKNLHVDNDIKAGLLGTIHYITKVPDLDYDFYSNVSYHLMGVNEVWFLESSYCCPKFFNR